MLGDGALDLVGRGLLGQRHEIGERHRDVLRLLVGELDGRRDRPGRVGEHALDARLVDDRRDLVEREGRGGLVLRLDAEQAQDAVGDPVERHDDGWKTFETHTSGVASISTARSGTENARFFGTISPKTTCRYDTSTSAMMNAMTSTAVSESPVRPSGTASRWWIAGSETFRISSEQIVMPSCDVASMSVACSIAYSAVLADARSPSRRAARSASVAPR